MLKYAGIDFGNDSIKLVLENQKSPLVIPNVISSGYSRQILQEEESPLKALDVIVNSHALSNNNLRYFVGELAIEDEDKSELEETENKAESDQSLIVALTSLAYMGLVNTQRAVQDEQLEIEYILGTGLPVRSFVKYHEVLRNKLIGQHEVTFISTPKLQNKKVKLNIRDAYVSIEGAAAIYHIATHDNLEIKDPELYEGCIGVCEIGALTTDFPVIKQMNIDNRFSYGEQMGMANYLDSIIRDVEDRYDYSFPSRAKIVQRIKEQNYMIQKIGEGQSDIKPIVDHYFNRASKRIVELIKKRWKKYPDIQQFYVIGGGAIALNPYLLEEAGSMKLHFVEESELLNVLGYLKLARKNLASSIDRPS